jgi:hypothetical protein
MLSSENINKILKDFPNVELSYETNIHKKVFDTDIILAIPEGKNYFAWFTSYKNKNVCFLLEIGDCKQIVNVSICISSFTNILYEGTIFYGTMFKNNSYFAIQNIFYNKGKMLESNFFEKLKLLKNIFSKDISQVSTSNKFVIFGLPLIVAGNNFNILLDNISNLPYRISKIHFQYLYKKNIYSMNYKPKNTNTKTSIFKVTPDIQNDIYYLHIYNESKMDYEYYDIACIPDYKTSVFMNTLFRNIKENINLDTLEESDDEEEFENNKIDKFVYLDKTFKMKCLYNYKFKKWTPISVVDSNIKKQLYSNSNLS